ncbi:MAG: hypothetical protein RSB55_06075 [Oscillospiraceae bacterium]
MPGKSPLSAPLGGANLAALLQNKALLETLMGSQDAQSLVSMLNQGAGGGLKTAAESAMKGDSAQLMRLLSQLLKDPENAQLLERISKTMPK